MTTLNIHATAIVVGIRGVLFIGPSGSGKSMAAYDCIEGARTEGLYGALVGDDRIDITVASGRLVARGPKRLRGLIEIRGMGIARIDTADAAVLDLAILPVAASGAPRLPETAARHCVTDTHALRLFHLPMGSGVRPWTILKMILSENAHIGVY